jgi:hypothetical protein
MGKSTIVLALLLGIFVCRPVAAASLSISLEEALKKKLVTATILGKGCYYGQSVKLKLKNISNQNLSISLEAGRRLNCVYDSVQDMLVTKSEMLALLPSQTKEFTIYAMCCEKSNRTPSETSTYNLGAMANSALMNLAILIEKLNVQDLTGVKAVWVISDGISPDEITGSDETTVKALKEYVMAVANKRKPAERDPNIIYDYSYPTLEGEVFTIEGDFDWEMPTPGFVSLYIYDNNGKQVKVVFQDLSATSGLQSYHYKVSDATFQFGELYWIRMKQNNRTIKELAVKME